jgi:hypothetical protein
MSKKRCRRKGLVKFFSSVGNGVFGLGGAVQKITPMHRTAAADKQGKVEERFEKTDKTLPVARHEENFDDWEGESGVREVRRRFSPRPAKFSNFQGWGQRISKFFRGLDVDLYRANMRTTPESYAVKIVGGSCLVTVFAITLMVFLNMPGWAVFFRRSFGVFIFNFFHQELSKAKVERNGGQAEPNASVCVTAYGNPALLRDRPSGDGHLGQSIRLWGIVRGIWQNYLGYEQRC